MTTAEKIAKQFDNDGTVWHDAHGSHLQAVCALYDGKVSIFDKGSISRHVFDDGSAITISGDAWDLGYRECNCWQGIGHTCK